MTPGYLCDYADISWQNSEPQSATYGDIYWHRDGAVAEKQQVFIRPLEAMAASLPSRSQLTVVELGFGFGINCLLAADFWQSLPTDRHLNFISIEKHPVHPHILKGLLKQYSFTAADRLLSQYPKPYVGQHVIWLAPNIRLILVLDDVETALAGLDASADLWFLDGFAPSKNESMWQPILFRHMFARSRPGATVATYSAAGHVRRHLSASGFETDKVTGFSHKKEMLKAKRPGNWQHATHKTGDTVIIGGGLAGHYCADALRKRANDVTVIDDGGPAASKIPQLTIKPQLAVQPEAKYRFSLLASAYMRESAGFHPTPVRWRGRTAEEQSRLKNIAALFPDNILQTDGDEVIFHEAGWLSFEELIRDADYPRQRSSIINIQREADHWLLKDAAGGRYAAENVILATGSNRSLLADYLSVRAIRGQALSVGTRDIEEILTHDVTVFPTVKGRSIVSGTYAREDNFRVDPTETAELLAAARSLTDIDEADLTYHMGIRAVSRDRLPIVGAAPEPAAIDAANRVSEIREFIPGFYYCTAFGSRGATHARLCAEQVISQLLAEPAAIDLRQQVLLSPARFRLRDRKPRR